MKTDKRLLAKSLFLYSVAVTIYVLIIDPVLSSEIFMRPLQELETGIVASLQAGAGIDVMVVEGVLLHYPENRLVLPVGPTCTGIKEIVLFSIIILLMLGYTMRSKLIGLGIFLPVIFFENLIRLSILHPIAAAYSKGAMESAHSAIWLYGQALFILAMLLLWLFFVAQREEDRKPEE